MTERINITKCVFKCDGADNPITHHTDGSVSIDMDGWTCRSPDAEAELQEEIAMLKSAEREKALREALDIMAGLLQRDGETNATILLQAIQDIAMLLEGEPYVLDLRYMTMTFSRPIEVRCKAKGE